VLQPTSAEKKQTIDNVARICVQLVGLNFTFRCIHMLLCLLQLANRLHSSNQQHPHVISKMYAYMYVYICPLHGLALCWCRCS